MTTSYNDRDSFSSSYSMLTSHVPSLDGDGQQLTRHIVSHHRIKRRRIDKKGRTREWNIGFVLPCVSPLEDTERLVDRESAGRILESDNALLLSLEFYDVGVLFELDLSSNARRGRSHRETDASEGII
jgi:hypothetical protein